MKPERSHALKLALQILDDRNPYFKDDELLHLAALLEDYLDNGVTGRKVHEVLQPSATLAPASNPWAEADAVDAEADRLAGTPADHAAQRIVTAILPQITAKLVSALTRSVPGDVLMVHFAAVPGAKEDLIPLATALKALVGEAEGA